MNWLSGYGIRVDRANAEVAPAAGDIPLFHVLGGEILVTQLYGILTVAMGAPGAVNTTLEAHPTTGTDEVLCALLDIDSYAQDDMLGFTGTFGDAMIPNPTGGAVAGLLHPFLLTIGHVALLTAANTTGEATWHMSYIPMTDGAYAYEGVNP